MRFVFAGLTLALLSMPASAQDGRTFVDRLSLDTPQGAAMEFVSAFKAKDFATAYFTLSPQAKRSFIDTYYDFNAGRYFNLEGTGFIDGSLMSEAELGEGELEELQSDGALIFDNLVFHAQRNGELPFDLTDADVTMVEDIGRDDAALVTVEGGVPQIIKMDAILLYNGDWRIDRIYWNGWDGQLKPWGAGTLKTKSLR
jgi:hypothetical protein